MPVGTCLAQITALSENPVLQRGLGHFLKIGKHTKQRSWIMYAMCMVCGKCFSHKKWNPFSPPLESGLILRLSLVTKMWWKWQSTNLESKPWVLVNSCLFVFHVPVNTHTVLLITLKQAHWYIRGHVQETPVLTNTILDQITASQPPNMWEYPAQISRASWLIPVDTRVSPAKILEIIHLTCRLMNNNQSLLF